MRKREPERAFWNDDGDDDDDDYDNGDVEKRDVWDINSFILPSFFSFDAQSRGRLEDQVVFVGFKLL